jgi:hypothetical protein
MPQSAKGRVKRRTNPPPVFRSRVEDELVDRLLRQFVHLVKQGLELMLSAPSDLTCKEQRKQPALLEYTAGDIAVWVAWVAQQAYEMAWPIFCQHVLAHPEWQSLLGVASQADLDGLAAGFAEQAPPTRLIELAVHDALKAGDKQDTRPENEQAAPQEAVAEFIGVSQVIRLLKRRLRTLLRRLDAQDPRRPAHRPRGYRTRSFLLADLIRWMLHLDSTDELIRKLERHACLAGAANFRPGEIPGKSTFSRRRMLIPLEDLQAILHELVEVLVRMRVIDGRAWVLDLSRLPTYSSVSKDYPSSPNDKSDPEAAFCGYLDNDGGFQLGYSLLFIVDFKTELPFALLFAGGSVQDGPLAESLLEQARTEHPSLAERCLFALGDGGYDSIHFFEYVLHRLRAIPLATKNPRHAADPQADLATDALCILRRPSLWHAAAFHSRTSVERTNGRIKLTFNLKYHKNRGWNAVEHCTLFSAIAMLAAAWVAVETGHPDKIRSTWTWIELA